MIPINSIEARKILVMLVDESDVFRSAAAFFLRQHSDIEVVGTLCRGDQALALAPLLKPEIVLLDSSSSGLPGLELIAQLQAVMPQVKVIVVTLLDVEAFRHAALAAGAAAFVSKVNARTDLLSAIRSVAQTEPNEVQEGLARPETHSVAKGGECQWPADPEY